MTDEWERYRRERAAAYLEHISGLARRVKTLELEMDELRESASGLKAIRYDGMPKGHNVSDDAMANVVSRIDDAIADYCTEMVNYLDERREAHRVLARLPRPEETEALTRHYLKGQEWLTVCIEMGYSWDGMKSIRYRALSKLYDVMPPEWRDPIEQAI